MVKLLVIGVTKHASQNRVSDIITDVTLIRYHEWSTLIIPINMYYYPELRNALAI